MNIFSPKFRLYPSEKASALCKFKMAMKQPTLASFHFKDSSNDHDKPSQTTSGENTDACSSHRLQTLVGPKKHYNVSI